MNKSKLMKTADLPNETLNKHLHNDRFSSAVDVIESEIFAKYFLIRKVIEFINLTSIIHDPAFRSSIHGDKNSFDIPAVVYNRYKPIHSKTFDFDKLLSNLGVDR